jgi:hypothetical protein
MIFVFMLPFVVCLAGKEKGVSQHTRQRVATPRIFQNPDLLSGKLIRVQIWLVCSHALLCVDGAFIKELLAGRNWLVGSLVA